MNTVMRLDNNGELYFQPKKDYIDELKHLGELYKALKEENARLKYQLSIGECK